MNPKTISFDVGKTAHGRPITLTWTSGPGDEKGWMIRRIAENQCDEDAVIFGIPDAVIEGMAAALREKKRMLE